MSPDPDTVKELEQQQPVRLRVLVIDDLRSFWESRAYEYVYARTYEEGLQQVVRWLDGVEHYDEVWLDHDLGEDPDPLNGGVTQTIRPIVLYIVEESIVFNNRRNTRIKVLTQNPVGRKWIFEQLDHLYPLYALMA